MPELPEVETVVRGLRWAVGRRIGKVWSSGQALRLARPVPLAAVRRAARSGPIAAVERRGKYIIFRLREPASLLVHLGMSGKLMAARRDEPRLAHTHVIFDLGDDHELRFVDPRRFGQVAAGFPVDDLPELASLGPEPLGPGALDVARFEDALASSRAPLKTFLLDQRRLAGVGNIYASEALFRARLNPRKPARAARRAAATLLAGVRTALEVGIDNRGTSLRDYVDARGLRGGNQENLLVYGRDGLPCFECGKPIRLQVDQGRATYWCPRCQR